jgi:transposase
MPTKPNDLFEYVDKTFPGHDVQMVYEAVGCGFHTARYFLNLGWEVLVVNLADIKRGDKERY